MLERFLLSKARWNLIQGPRGSGKSTAAIIKLAMQATAQPPGPDGVRRRRTYVVRNTYDDLLRTTIASWKIWFPEAQFGSVKLSKPYRHHIRVGDLDWEVVFLALDDEESRKKLLSAEVSDIWFNEFREILRDIMEDADGPLGRYPSKAQGGCLNPMVIADTNAPPPDHWFSYMSGQMPIPLDVTEDERRQLVKPPNREIFLQPGALLEEKDPDGRVIGYRDNPEAENVAGHDTGAAYWHNLIQGKSAAWIRVNVLNKPGHLQEGDQVWPQFAPHRHVARQRLDPVAGHPVLFGQDFGRTPAMVAGQLVHGRWRILFEKAVPRGKSMGAREFAKLARLALAQRFPGFTIRGWGDPAGEHMAEADDISPFMMFRAEGFTILPAPTNDPTVRINAVIETLNDLMDGEPRFLVCPEGCPHLVAAMDGGYQYPKGDKIGPVKNHHSHIADALQYLMLGAGEGRAVLGGRPASAGNVVHMQQHRASRKGNVFTRRGLKGFGRG